MLAAGDRVSPVMTAGILPVLNRTGTGVDEGIRKSQRPLARSLPLSPPRLEPLQCVLAPDAQDMVIHDRGLQLTLVNRVLHDVDAHSEERCEFLGGENILMKQGVQVWVPPTSCHDLPLSSTQLPLPSLLL